MPRLLIVEDDPSAAALAATTLTAAGHTVLATVGDAPAARGAVTALAPDLVLMDVRLGRDDGVRLARALGRPSLFVTGDVDAATLARIGEADPYGVVLKPYAPGQLTAAVAIAAHRIALERRVAHDERRLVAIAARLPVAVFSSLADDPWRIDYISPVIQAIAGVPAEQLLGAPAAARAMVHPDDLARVEAEVAQAFARGDVLTALELRVGGGDGCQRWVRIDACRVRGDDGVPLCFGGVITDIDARRRSERALAVQGRDAAIGRMAGAVAHAINNPLAAIKARLHLLAREVPTAALPALDALGAQAERIASTVRDLQALARPAAGSGSGNVARAAHEVAALFAHRSRSHGIALNVAVASGLPATALPDHGLQQVLVHLVENACDALAERGGTVRIAAQCANGALTLTVSDDGPGLGDDPERCFAPFHSTKAQGAGLGLTLARALCERAGGTLVADAVAAGATLRAQLPLAGST